MPSMISMPVADFHSARVAAGSASPAATHLRKELQDFVKETVAPYKYPRAIEFIAALPRTETGKLQRFKLRALG